MAIKIFPDAMNEGARHCTFYSSPSTYIGWVTSGGDIWVGKYDWSYQLSQCTRIRTGLSADDHNHPAVLELRSDGTSPGKVLAVWMQHSGGASGSFLSVNQKDVRLWNAEVSLGTNNTYPWLFQGNDTAKTVYLFYRNGPSQFNYTWGYRTTTDGSTWSSYTSIGSGGNGDWYLKIGQDFSNPNNIHFGVFNAGTAGLYYFLGVIQTNGTIKFYKEPSAATEITPPFNDVTQFTSLDADTSSLVWQTAVCGGKPVILYFRQTNAGANIWYRRAQWSGSSWATDAIVGADSSATGEGAYSGPDYLFYSQTRYAPGGAWDTNDSTGNTVYLGIAFAGNIVVGTSGRLTDIRIQKWVCTGGVWAKDSTVTSTTGEMNSRPHMIQGRSPTQLLWVNGTETDIYTFSSDYWISPDLTRNTTKPSVVQWASAVAPPQTSAYYALQEGTGGNGATINDATGNYNTTLTGAPTWGSGTYGYELSGFSTTKYIGLDALAANMMTYPRYILAWVKNSDTTAGAVICSFNTASGNTSAMQISYNQGATGTLGALIRGPANDVSWSVAARPLNDGNYHLIWLLSSSANSHALYFDGVLQSGSSANIGTIASIAKGVIGAQWWSGAVASPFKGTIGAIVLGWNASNVTATTRDAIGLALYHDFSLGQFGGLRGLGPVLATLTGPTTGTVNVASDDYTITLDQAAQAGGVSCVVGSSVVGDTVATSPVTIAQGATTGTFKVTPSTAGDRNVSLSSTTPSLSISGSPIVLTAAGATTTTTYPGFALVLPPGPMHRPRPGRRGRRG